MADPLGVPGVAVAKTDRVMGLSSPGDRIRVLNQLSKDLHYIQYQAVESGSGRLPRSHGAGTTSV